MDQNFNIIATKESPSVFLKNNGLILCIQGRSTSANATETFHQILIWMDEFMIKNNQKSLRFEFKLDFYNTLTSRLLLDVFLKMEKMKGNGYNVGIDWHYEKHDADLKEAGEAYATMVQVPFVFYPY